MCDHDGGRAGGHQGLGKIARLDRELAPDLVAQSLSSQKIALGKIARTSSDTHQLGELLAEYTQTKQKQGMCRSAGRTVGCKGAAVPC